MGTAAATEGRHPSPPTLHPGSLLCQRPPSQGHSRPTAKEKEPIIPDISPYSPTLVIGRAEGRLRPCVPGEAWPDPRKHTMLLAGHSPRAGALHAQRPQGTQASRLSTGRRPGTAFKASPTVTLSKSFQCQVYPPEPALVIIPSVMDLLTHFTFIFFKVFFHSFDRDHK